MENAPDRAIQYTAFREQIGLARELGYPIVFHSRESHDEVFRLLREERPDAGVADAQRGGSFLAHGVLLGGAAMLCAA